MAGFEIIRVYSQRAREGAAGFAARPAGPGRILFWLLAIPLAILIFLIGLVLVAVVAVVLLVRGAILAIAARIGGLLGFTPLRSDGRRNVRVIQPRERQ